MLGGSNFIKISRIFAFSYAKNLIKGRWPDLEPLILNEIKKFGNDYSDWKKNMYRENVMDYIINVIIQLINTELFIEKVNFGMK